MMLNSIDFFCLFWFYFHFSLCVHPNKLLVATGQCAGHNKNDALVCSLFTFGFHMFFFLCWFLDENVNFSVFLLFNSLIYGSGIPYLLQRLR